ncbi:MAG: polysaccharide pyruvyl transferase family protein [Lachnospiraceae bacterium]|nr:polysaccharide pyruvyl transferase family protein [Lachnospiraceae bacterium]
MLNVYGITLDHTINYGSCLQTYALHKAITGIELSSGEQCSYQLIPIRTFKEIAHRTYLQPIIALFRRRFASFENKHLKFADLHSLEELPSLNEKADAFVCGSDVIWNPDFSKNQLAYYLDFARKYKFSYAASFGKAEIDEEAINVVRKPISELNEISVREKTGADLIMRFFGKTASVVADPVLLLTRDEWESVLPGSKQKKGHIFVYITHLNQTMKEFIVKLKKTTGLKVIYSAYGPKQVISQGMLLVQTPQKWLQLLHDAEYVVTNSFHATVFSVLFRRKFFTVTKNDKDKGINVRMNDFLTEIGLGDRIFSVIPKQLDLSEIAYDDISRKIETMREQSLEFLRGNLEKAYFQKTDY